jgi:hypothetical protein
MQGAGKLIVWSGIWGNKIVGIVSFDTNLNAETNLNVMEDTIMPFLLYKDGESLEYLQQAGSPPHDCIRGRRSLNQ